MPVRRDPRTNGWRFRAIVRYPDGTRERVFGTPGVPGPYQDLANSKAGALEAEQRAKHVALTGRPVNMNDATRGAAALNDEKENDSEKNDAAKAKTKTIREHAENFVDLYKPGSKPSEKRTKRWTLDKRLLPFFGDLTIEALKQSDVDRFAALELKTCAVKSVNNRLAVLSTLIKYVTGEKSKLRFKLDGMVGELASVPTEDVEKLLAAAIDGGDDRYYVALLLAAEAGLRAGEIRGLQWGDLRDGQVTVRRALDTAKDEVIAPKHNRIRTIPLAPRLVAALDALPRRGIWVVSRLDGETLGYYGMVDAIGAIYEVSKVTKPPKPIHCLRHTFGTVMAKRVPLGVLQKLMGHAEVTTTMRYVDVSEDDKREAIATVFGTVATPVAPIPTPGPKLLRVAPTWHPAKQKRAK